MPADHARKDPVRRRQAVTGESYTDAAKAQRRADSRAVWDPWTAPRCEVEHPVPGHDQWFTGPCPKGCPTRELPAYVAYLETLPPKQRLPRPTARVEPSVCPGPATCTELCCDIPLSVCPACDAVYEAGFGVPCPNCGHLSE